MPFHFTGRLTYGILEDTDFIVIDRQYGQVLLNKTIDKEEISHLSFTVLAFDSVGHVVCITNNLHCTCYS